MKYAVDPWFWRALDNCPVCPFLNSILDPPATISQI